MFTRISGCGDIGPWSPYTSIRTRLPWPYVHTTMDRTQVTLYVDTYSSVEATCSCHRWS
ncbi:hypothetical protein [Paenibacillus odorifer]|uniref:hypothetical protein n=1 Tax=Paenibacillus odorifer TaxID=189426 RepID=UPI0020C12052|nr:hypothetical protein [Paenibacillus odorifer]